MKRCSIVISCYNYAQYLGECIESCLAQTYPCEIIVVDDCSTDSTPAVAKSYPILYVRHSENWGLSKARNTGISLARGDKILCLDADDMIHPTLIEKGVDLDGIVVYGVENFGDAQAKVLPYHDLSLEAFKVQNRITCASLFDKKDWEAVGGFDENMKLGREDWDFWLSLLKRGVKITPIQECLFLYRMHGVAMARRADEIGEQLFQYIKNKHKDLYG